MSLPPARDRSRASSQAQPIDPQNILDRLPTAATDIALGAGEAAEFEELRSFLLREFNPTSSVSVLLIHSVASVMWQMRILQKARNGLIRDGITKLIRDVGMFSDHVAAESIAAWRSGDELMERQVYAGFAANGVTAKELEARAYAANIGAMAVLESTLAALERRQLRLIRELDRRNAMGVLLRAQEIELELRERKLAQLKTRMADD